MTEAKFKIGEHVYARNSGKAYIVLAAWASDMCGSYTYAVRGWRGGRHYGPTRKIGESGLTEINYAVSEKH